MTISRRCGGTQSFRGLKCRPSRWCAPAARGNALPRPEVVRSRGPRICRPKRSHGIFGWKKSLLLVSIAGCSLFVVVVVVLLLCCSCSCCCLLFTYIFLKFVSVFKKTGRMGENVFFGWSGGGEGDPLCFIQISSSWVKIRLHTENHLPKLSGSALKV